MKILNIEEIEKKIGYVFNDKRILVEAFTHSSYANENADLSYERLEFLGDSILGFVISNFLFKQYSNEDEGFLTKTKASIVSGKSLAKAMTEMGLIEHLRTAQGSIEEEVKVSDNIKEDLFEALIGAIFIDSENYLECEKFIFRHLAKFLVTDYLDNKNGDYKSKLLEYAAKRKNSFEIKFEVRPLGVNVNGGFEAYVYVNGERYGRGEGISKKKAEQKAARETLDILKI